MTDLRLKSQRYIEDYINYLQSLSHRRLRFVEKYSEINMSYSYMDIYAYGHDEVENAFGQLLTDYNGFKYKISGYVWGEDDNILYLSGSINYKNEDKEKKVIGVMIKLMISNDGKILSHHEYRDNILPEVKKKGFIKSWFSN